MTYPSRARAIPLNKLPHMLLEVRAEVIQHLLMAGIKLEMQLPINIQGVIMCGHSRIQVPDLWEVFPVLTPPGQRMLIMVLGVLHLQSNLLYLIIP